MYIYIYIYINIYIYIYIYIGVNPTYFPIDTITRPVATPAALSYSFLDCVSYDSDADAAAFGGDER